MEKNMKILLVHTGGTIGSTPSVTQQAREQNSETVEKAKKDLIVAFENSRSVYANDIEIVDADFPGHLTTLSESMTLGKLSEIVLLIRDKIYGSNEYSGVIVLHGTDTLAYTSALFAFVFANIQIPMFLVSGNRPPQDPSSNASVNFISAIELICRGIAPNVYVTYRNSDDKMRLYLASNIVQSPNFSEDFSSGSKNKVFELETGENQRTLALCHQYSENRVNEQLTDIMRFNQFSDSVLLVRPYTGLDYSIYDGCFDSRSARPYKGVVHGTYHSGTVSWPGLVLKKEAMKCLENNALKQADKYEAQSNAEAHSVQSIYHLAEICKEHRVPLYIAPSALGDDQYETMNAVNNCFVTNKQTAGLLNMTTEAAYAKLTVALSFGMTADETARYMNTVINNE